MNFNLVSKNNCGIVATLFLLILLTQAKIFNFLLDTALGRAVLLLFILFISYTNQILGVVSVLIVIILFNTSNLGYLEGFTADASKTDASKNNAPKTNAEKEAEKQRVLAREQEREKEREKVKTHMASKSTMPPTAMPAAQATTSTSAEGFDLIGTETFIKRGKKDRSFAIGNHVKQSKNVDPFEPNVDAYASV